MHRPPLLADQQQPHERAHEVFVGGHGEHVDAGVLQRSLQPLFARVGRDASITTNRPKDIYKRQRPYLIDQGATCIPKSDDLAKSPDYPSGHNTWGWAVGLILAELAPDRATPIMARARAFGESRMVCGVHNMSAVHMGWANGSMMVAALHGKPDFRRDLEAVRQEVAAVRKTAPAPDAAMCKAEAETIAQNPY